MTRSFHTSIYLQIPYSPCSAWQQSFQCLTTNSNVMTMKPFPKWVSHFHMVLPPVQDSIIEQTHNTYIISHLWTPKAIYLHLNVLALPNSQVVFRTFSPLLIPSNTSVTAVSRYWLLIGWQDRSITLHVWTLWARTTNQWLAILHTAHQVLKHPLSHNHLWLSKGRRHTPALSQSLAYWLDLSNILKCS